MAKNIFELLNNIKEGKGTLLEVLLSGLVPEEVIFDFHYRYLHDLVNREQREQGPMPTVVKDAIEARMEYQAGNFAQDVLRAIIRRIDELKLKYKTASEQGAALPTNPGESRYLFYRVLHQFLYDYPKDRKSREVYFERLLRHTKLIQTSRVDKQFREHVEEGEGLRQAMIFVKAYMDYATYHEEHSREAFESFKKELEDILFSEEF